MIGCFPDPYPDELLYSVYSRYQKRTRFSCININLELFHLKTKNCYIDLPVLTDVLAKKLPYFTIYDMNYFLKNNSLLPLYLPFLPKKEKHTLQSRLCQPSRPPLLIDSYTSYSSISGRLRYCPQCVYEDRLTFGETYWHRLQQVKYVRVCPEHLIILVETNIPIKLHPRNRFCYVENYFAAEDVIKYESQIPSEPNNYLNSFQGKVTIEVARNAQWLLDFGNLNFSHEYCFKEQYAYMTADKLGVPLSAISLPYHISGNILSCEIEYFSEFFDSFTRLIELFINYYSHNFLCEWDCPMPRLNNYGVLGNRLESYWVYSLISDVARLTLPSLCHFLFMHFLGINVSTLMLSDVDNSANFDLFGDY